MNYEPYYSEAVTMNNGLNIPSTVSQSNNRSYAYFERALFQRACSVIDFNVPFVGAVKDFFIYCLFRGGYVGIFESDTYGLMFQPCTINGHTVYYQPAKFMVTNPYDSNISKEYTIGVNGELIKLTPDYMGIWDIISYYAGKLAELNLDIDVSLINLKIPDIIAAKNKAAALAIKKIKDDVNAGNPTVVYDKVIEDEDGESPFQVLKNDDIKNKYILTEQLQDFQTIMNAFDNEIGIPTVPYQKKERMVTSEAESRQIDSQSRATLWTKTLNESMEVVNKHFNTNMSAVYLYAKEVDTDEDNINRNE